VAGGCRDALVGGGAAGLGDALGNALEAGEGCDAGGGTGAAAGLAGVLCDGVPSVSFELHGQRRLLIADSQA